MGQILQQDNIPSLVIASITTITLASTFDGKSTRITVGGQQYRASSTLTLNLATTGLNGLDTGTLAANTLYYIYAVVSSGTLGLVASTANRDTGPTGFSAWNEIGRFRTKLGAAETATDAIADWRNGWLATPSTGPAIAYTPNQDNFGTIADVEASYKRHSDGIQVAGRFTAGTVSGSAAAVYIPSHLNIKSMTQQLVVGRWYRVNSSSTTRKTGPLAANTGATTQSLKFGNDTYDNASSVLTAIGASSVVSSSEGLHFEFEVPIAEFQGLFTD